MERSTQSNLAGLDTNWSRRAFLATAAGGLAGLAAGRLEAAQTRALVSGSRAASHVIFINLVGGPSQIDTWDPKPDADSAIRNFDPACATTLPGVFISENLPRMSQRMHLVSLVRSLQHAGPATHAAGQQQLMTGHCFYHDRATPYFGSVVSQTLGGQRSRLENVVLGGPLAEDLVGETGCQSAADRPGMQNPTVVENGSSRDAYRDFIDVSTESWETQRNYGFHDLGRMCLQARRLIEHGSRVVTINQFPTVFDRTTWDMHANGGRLNSNAADYREVLCPQLDQALSGLLDDLHNRGLLSETVVAVSGEMGRTPRINQYGGRDHHTGVWSGLLAGGPIRGGQVVGASDACGEFPSSRPVTPAEFCAAIYRALGLQASTLLLPLDAEPITELL